MVYAFDGGVVSEGEAQRVGSLRRCDLGWQRSWAMCLDGFGKKEESNVLKKKVWIRRIDS